MRRRWIIALARTGTVLLVVGLVLALVSVTPSAPTGFMSSSGTKLRPSSYYVNPFTKIYSPTSGLRARVSSNHSVELHLLDTDYPTFTHWTRAWVMERIPGLDEDQIGMSMLNLSVLEAYLEAHPENVLLSQSLGLVDSVDYFPPKPTNATAVFSNPSEEWADIDIRIAGVTSLVPKERVLIPTLATLILGIGLTLPWASTRARRSKG